MRLANGPLGLVTIVILNCRKFRVCMGGFQLGYERLISTLFGGNFGGDFPHLHKAHRRYRVCHRDSNAVGVFH